MLERFKFSIMALIAAKALGQCTFDAPTTGLTSPAQGAYTATVNNAHYSKYDGCCPNPLDPRTDDIFFEEVFVSNNACVQTNLNTVLYTYPFFPRIKESTNTDLTLNNHCKIEEKLSSNTSNSSTSSAKLHWSADNNCPVDDPLLVVLALEDFAGNILVANYILINNNLNPDTATLTTADNDAKLSELKSGFCDEITTLSSSWVTTTQSDISFTFGVSSTTTYNMSAFTSTSNVHFCSDAGVTAVYTLE